MEVNYEDLATEIFNEQNRIRKDPSCYIEKLERALKFFKGKVFRHPAEIPVETYEGEEGVKKAINFLKTQESLDPLKYSRELSKAAFDHVYDIGSKGLSSHEGSDGNGISDRIERYIEWDGAIAENLDFCYKFAENVVMNLVIDDGSKEKHQRANLFNNNFKYVGIGCGQHKSFKTCTVINYAKGLHAIGDEPADVVNSVQDYIAKTMNKEKTASKNPFQDEDPDAPDDTMSVKLVKMKKTIKGTQRNITRKIYLLKNGKQHIVEIENKE